MNYETHEDVSENKITALDVMHYTVQRVHICEKKVNSVMKKRVKAEDNLQRFNTINEHYMNKNAFTKAGYWFLNIAVICVFGFDFLVMTALTHYIIDIGFGSESSFLLWTARILVPFFIIMLESALGILILYSKHSRNGLQTGNKKAMIGYIILGLMIASLTAFAWIVTNSAELVYQEDNNQRIVTIWLMVIGCFLALGSHCFIVFGGKLLAEAHGYLSFIIGQAKLKRMKNKFFKEEEKSLVLFDNSVMNLEKEKKKHELLYGTYECKYLPSSTEEFIELRFNNFQGHTVNPEQ